MNPKHSLLFQSIGDAIQDRRRDRQLCSKNCTKVLEEKIRPAIEQARQFLDLRGESMEFNPGKEPYIRISLDELRFICIGDTVEILSRVGQDQYSHLIDTQDVSVDLVVKRIAHFFRRVYGLRLISVDQ